jgi:hypothetical protein
MVYIPEVSRLVNVGTMTLINVGVSMLHDVAYAINVDTNVLILEQR